MRLCSYTITSNGWKDLVTTSNRVAHAFFDFSVILKALLFWCAAECFYLMLHFKLIKFIIASII